MAIVWGCARALWTRILEFVRATVAPAGKVSTGCALRFANVGSLEHFVRGVYAVDQLKPEGLALKLRSLAPCAREALVLNLSVPYPLYRPKGTLLNGSTGPDISIVMEDLKFHVRAHFGPQIANYTHDISFHVGDNEAVHAPHGLHPLRMVEWCSSPGGCALYLRHLAAWTADATAKHWSADGSSE